MPEVWKAVPGYEGLYEVGAEGRVRSLGRTWKSKHGVPVTAPAKMLKPRMMSVGGHVRVALMDSEHVRYDWMIHRLVLTAFVGPPGVGQEGCHNNGVPDDNRLANLRWDSRAANMADAIQHGSHIAVARRAQTHCLRGHELLGENLYLYLGIRHCRECRRLHDRKRAN